MRWQQLVDIGTGRIVSCGRFLIPTFLGGVFVGMNLDGKYVNTAWVIYGWPVGPDECRLDRGFAACVVGSPLRCVGRNSNAHATVHDNDQAIEL